MASLAAIGATAAYYAWCSAKPLPAGFATLLEATVNISAIAVGFLASAKAIILGANDQVVVKKLRESKQLKPLMSYFMAAIWWCLFMTMLSAAMLLLDFTKGSQLNDWIVATWVFLAAGSALACLRVIWLFNQALRQFH